jgi:NhaC family Na+:H+ antiporter
MHEIPKAKIWQAIIPIVFLVILLTLNVQIFGDSTLAGPNQIALILAAGLAAVFACTAGLSWEYIRRKIVESIGSSMASILILFVIGSLSGTWMLSGVVPVMIYYGLQILNPSIFLVAAVIISSVTSLVTGSSWSTVATIGIALLGIGQALGFNEAVVAGAIISGAYFGDKISPLSDTTNLAPAMAGTDLFTHVKYMLFTTVPTMILTLIIFFVIGLLHPASDHQSGVDAALLAISSSFVITPWLLLVPVILFVLIIKKVAPIPALMAGTLIGGVFALIFQPQIVAQIGASPDVFKASYVAFAKAMFGEISIHTSNQAVNELLHTRGMSGMLNTVWLIISAMVFGGVMEAAGYLRLITMSIIGWAQSTGSLVATTAATCIFFNLTASDQYLSIVVPGRMFASTFRERKLAPEP